MKTTSMLTVMAFGLMAITQPLMAKPLEKPLSREAADLALFERKAALSKELGATQMMVTEALPIAMWKLDKDDPYPAWFAHHADIMTIFAPKDVQPYIDMAFAQKLTGVLAKRCAILGKYGLKGVWQANEPAILPEAFFTAHPELRGPRIDQPNRSRKVYFAPNVDHPETLRMYRESIQLLLKTCPQVETFNWTTTDAGSGFDWTPSLYPGINGNANYRDRPIADRVSGFMVNIQKAAKDAGHDIRISINPIEPRQWMIPTFAPDVMENIIRKLPRGLAIDHIEGPDGRKFSTGIVTGGGASNVFYPVVGLSSPTLASISAPVQTDGQTRLQYNLGDPASIDFNYRLFKATRDLSQGTITQRIAALRAFAASEVGEDKADNLIEVWSALADVKRNLDVLDFGGMLRFGHVLNRWITRPMVPFPEELTADEKKDYRSYLFQAKGEAQANDLADIQAMRMYEGWGAKLLFQRDIETAMPRARKALGLIKGLSEAAKTDEARQYWELTGKRLQAAIYLMESADTMVAYEAQLDRVKGIGIKPEADPVLSVQSGWDRTELMALARKEIDTMVNLKQLLDSTDAPILDLASTREDETIMKLGPNVSVQLKHKIDTMNAHWRDYDRLFTVPNP